MTTVLQTACGEGSHVLGGVTANRTLTHSREWTDFPGQLGPSPSLLLRFFQLLFWRVVWDSNPREAFANQFCRLLPSTARTTTHVLWHRRRGSNPPGQVESLVTSPEVNGDISLLWSRQESNLQAEATVLQTADLTTFTIYSTKDS